VLYLDLTDTWFESGGGELARRGRTKQGHRSKWKIHIALLVNQEGLPMRWRLLPGALSETTVLPEWLDYLDQRSDLERAVLIFDRGMPSAENFQKLVGNGQLQGQDKGRLFLTSVKSDAIPTYTKLDQNALDALQALPDSASSKQVAQACSAIGLLHLKAETYARDLGIVTPPKPRSARRVRPPGMRMYLAFNREVQTIKREGRNDRIDQARRFVKKLNEDLRKAKQPRKHEPTLRKVTRILEKLKLLEIFDVKIEPYGAPGKTKPIASYQVIIKLRATMLRAACRYDGITLLVGHPQLDMTAAEAIAAYRQKNVVEANFRTIKSVLKIRPTFHWTAAKIQSHVTICTLALLIERLIEKKLLLSSLSAASRPDSADALLKHLLDVSLDRVNVDDTVYTVRTTASQRISSLLQAIDADHLLDAYPSSVKIPVTPV
jgi:transposase